MPDPNRAGNHRIFQPSLRPRASCANASSDRFANNKRKKPNPSAAPPPSFPSVALGTLVMIEEQWGRVCPGTRSQRANRDLILLVSGGICQLLKSLPRPSGPTREPGVLSLIKGTLCGFDRGMARARGVPSGRGAYNLRAGPESSRKIIEYFSPPRYAHTPPAPTPARSGPQIKNARSPTPRLCAHRVSRP